jgi:hypothetical protein
MLSIYGFLFFNLQKTGQFPISTIQGYIISMIESIGRHRVRILSINELDSLVACKNVYSISFLTASEPSTIYYTTDDSTPNYTTK